MQETIPPEALLAGHPDDLRHDRGALADGRPRHGARAWSSGSGRVGG